MRGIFIRVLGGLKVDCGINMAETLRRSARLAGQKTDVPVLRASKSLKYCKGQGLVLKSGAFYRLGITSEEVLSSSHSFLVFLLQESGNELKYEKDKEITVQSKEVINEIALKPEGKYFKITKKQLYEINSAFEISSEEESVEVQVSKRKTSTKPPVAKKTKGKKPMVYTTYKKGVANPNVKVIPYNEYLSDPSNDPKFGVSIRINSLNFHRAVVTNNKVLLKNLSASIYKIGFVLQSWGPEYNLSCLERAILLNNEFFVKKIIEELVNPKIKRGYQPPSALALVSTGSVCKEAYGVRTRAVQMSRGGREGNNAFLFETAYHDGLQILHTPGFVKNLLKKGVSSGMITLIMSLEPVFENILGMQIGECVRSGNLELASFLITHFNKKGGYGLNFLHEEVLKKAPLSVFKKTSVTKKPIENYCFAPLHTACINPDPKHLISMIAVCDDINYPDQEGRKAIHYSAACISSAPLKVLLDHGCNANDHDKFKVTPLMVSAIYNRPEPCKLLIEKGVPMHLKSKDGRAAIHFAAQNGNIEVLEILLNNGANIEQPGTDRKTPLMFAAIEGHFECIKLLIERGAKVVKKDKCKRTALIWAVKNGHSREVSLLLAHGSPYDEPDSSKNSALHYAAAYGWVECISLLIKAGANVNVGNDWKLQPLLIAMLKGQIGCVKILLEQPGVDVNGKDENGRTLVSQSIEMLTEEGLVQLKYLLTEKNADPNIEDIQKFTALHHLANRGKPVCDNTTMAENDRKEWENMAWNWQVTAAGYLLDAGCEIDLKTTEGLTAVMYAMKNKNTRLVELLISRGADMKITSPNGGGVFHYLVSFDPDVMQICKMLLGKKDITRSALNSIDEAGFSPFLRCVEFFGNELGNHRGKIGEEEKKKMEYEMQTSKTQAVVSEIASGPLSHNTTSPFYSAASQVNSGINSYLLSNMSLQMDYKELEIRINNKLQQAVNHFVDLMKKMVEQGADCFAVVQKLKKYREDPELIKNEEATYVPVQNYYGNTEKKEFFITDLDGVKIYKEYCDKGLQNALHILAQNSQLDMVKFLISLNISVNQRDFNGNTPLNLFVKSGNLYTGFLLEASGDVNVFNVEGESSIFSAVSGQNVHQLDAILKHKPILNILNKAGTSPLILAVEKKNISIVRKLLEAGADPNFQNIKKRTSLHIAFDVSEATANASFDMESLLLLYKADINALDCRNRSPLHYCFIKIGKSQNMEQIDPIESVSSACSLKGVNVNIQDTWKKTPLHYAAQRGALTSSMFLLSKDAELDLEDEHGNTALALSIREGHANYAVMLVQKGANVMKTVIVPPKKPPKVPAPQIYNNFSLFGNTFYNQNLATKPANLPEGTYSMFKAAIIQGWQGLAYLLLFNGYPYMLAMQDAMTQKKFQLVKTLLAKVSDNSVLQQVNESKQNLFHTLAIYGSQAELDITKVICEQLIERKVSLHEVDVTGKNPLHYAARSDYFFFMQILLEQGVRHDLYDRDGFCPLAYAIAGGKIRNCLATLKMFYQFGASFKFVFDECQVSLTPLLHAIKEKAPADVIKYLLDCGCSLQETDSKGRNAFMYAITNNDAELVRALITEGTLNLLQTDKAGRTALHYAVQPLPYGSYENIQILDLLLKQTSNPHSLDIHRQSPYHLACLQRSGRLLEVFQRAKVTGPGPEYDKISEFQAEDDEFDYIGDSEAYIKAQKDIRKVTPIKRKPDENGAFPDYYEVLEDYDLIMTKVDLSYGPYSAYVFYRMQVLVDTNRDVYVLYTRWGRIGEVGASQRTPFADKEEAVSEFKKIFKAKSSNEWGGMFERKKGKYAIMKLELEKVNCKDFISEFSLEVPESNLEKTVVEAVKNFSSQMIYRACFRSFNVDVNILNFSNLSKQAIDEAEHLMLEIAKLSKRMKGESDTSIKIEIIQEVQDLSSRYYELIPIIHQTNTAVAPIIHPNIIKQNLDKLLLLRNIELASKVILGALHQQTIINPYDYIYTCLDTNIKCLENNDEEAKLIIKYLEKGGGNGKKVSIFKLNRKGEAQRISKFQHVKNRKLLWHGTSSANFVGILMQGLKIAPPEVPNMGYMFGKGVYFADHFNKSQGYCSQELMNSTGYFILLCEVVLGEMLLKYEAEFIEKLPSGYLSTLGCGNTAPDPKESVFTPYGVEVPVGTMINQVLPNVNYHLGHNEYIVYDTAQIRIRYMLHIKQ